MGYAKWKGLRYTAHSKLEYSTILKRMIRTAEGRDDDRRNEEKKLRDKAAETKTETKAAPTWFDGGSNNFLAR